MYVTYKHKGGLSIFENKRKVPIFSVTSEDKYFIIDSLMIFTISFVTFHYFFPRQVTFDC